MGNDICQRQLQRHDQRTLEDCQFGVCKVFRLNPDALQFWVERTSVFNSPQSLLNAVANIQKVKEFKKSFLVKPIHIKHNLYMQGRLPCCRGTPTLTCIEPYFNQTLANFIDSLKPSKAFLSQGQIWYILETLVEIYLIHQHLSLPSPRILSAYIFISHEGELKTSNRHSYPSKVALSPSLTKIAAQILSRNSQSRQIEQQHLQGLSIPLRKFIQLVKSGKASPRQCLQITRKQKKKTKIQETQKINEYVFLEEDNSRIKNARHSIQKLSLTLKKQEDSTTDYKPKSYFFE